MARIAVITPLFPTSAEPYRGNAIYRTVRALQRWSEVEVFCPQSVYPKAKWLQPRSTRYRLSDPDFSPEGVRAHYLTYPALPLVSRPFNGSNCARVLLPALREAAPDLILAYWIYPAGFAAGMVGERLGIPVIMGSRGTDLNNVSDPLTSFAIRRSLRKATLVLTVSEDLRRQAIHFGTPPDKVRTVPNGCDLDVFRPAPRMEARRRLGVSPDARLILFTGWLAPLKGIGELFEATAGLAGRFPSVELACIGEGRLAEEFKARAAAPALAGRVRFLGARTSAQIAEWLAASDVLCLPSHTEGCPNAALEALCCGRPVVATNVGGSPELIDPACGLLVPPRDPQALSAALAEALDRPWDEHAIASRFSRGWEDVAAETYAACSQFLPRQAAIAHA